MFYLGCTVPQKIVILQVTTQIFRFPLKNLEIRKQQVLILYDINQMELVSCCTFLHRARGLQFTIAPSYSPLFQCTHGPLHSFILPACPILVSEFVIPTTELLKIYLLQYLYLLYLLSAYLPNWAVSSIRDCVHLIYQSTINVYYLPWHSNIY